MTQLSFAALAAKAHEAGMAAVGAAQVVPMVVQERASPLDDTSAVKKEWFVADGVCGFAWVKFKGNTAWGKYAKANLGAKAAYGGGLQIWVSAFSQSMQKKEAYATAYAAVLQEAGIAAYADSRMD